MTILFWGDAFVPILRDLAEPLVPEAMPAEPNPSDLGALYLALNQNNIATTSLEDFIAADSDAFAVQAIELVILPLSGEP